MPRAGGAQFRRRAAAGAGAFVTAIFAPHASALGATTAIFAPHSRRDQRHRRRMPTCERCRECRPRFARRRCRGRRLRFARRRLKSSDGAHIARGGVRGDAGAADRRERR